MQTALYVFKFHVLLLCDRNSKIKVSGHTQHMQVEFNHEKIVYFLANLKYKGAVICSQLCVQVLIST